MTFRVDEKTRDGIQDRYISIQGEWDGAICGDGILIDSRREIGRCMVIVTESFLF
jgi:hypothetical protein